jgi:hypothetical protein
LSFTDILNEFSFSGVPKKLRYQPSNKFSAMIDLLVGWLVSSYGQKVFFMVGILL